MQKKLPSYILLVDDEANVRTVFSDVLKRAGYRVKVVEDGHEAIKELEQKTYNLALVDLRMPKMGGIQVLESLKKIKPELPVIIYTGYGSVTTAVEAMRKGASNYLSKPFSPEELKLAIKKALEQKDNPPQPLNEKPARNISTI